MPVDAGGAHSDAAGGFPLPPADGDDPRTKYFRGVRPFEQTQCQNGGRPQIDLAAAAAKLGVTLDALRAALGDPSQGPPDFAAAAAQLGVTEQELIDALGIPAGGQPPVGAPQG